MTVNLPHRPSAALRRLIASRHDDEAIANELLEAIARSVSHSEIVTIVCGGIADQYDTVARLLAEACEGSVEDAGEYWGARVTTDADGYDETDEWRVHVAREDDR
jgi:hypothetical protein